jgi:DNA polymerase I-like protein with 3'-5' exonuclease and polymerase domains
MTDTIEVDILEAVREVERLIKAEHTGTDLYLQALSNVTGVPLAEIPPELRAPLKLASFGARYGVSSATIRRLVADVAAAALKKPPPRE